MFVKSNGYAVTSHNGIRQNQDLCVKVREKTNDEELGWGLSFSHLLERFRHLHAWQPLPVLYIFIVISKFCLWSDSGTFMHCSHCQHYICKFDPLMRLLEILLDRLFLRVRRANRVIRLYICQCFGVMGPTL